MWSIFILILRYGYLLNQKLILKKIRSWQDSALGVASDQL